MQYTIAALLLVLQLSSPQASAQYEPTAESVGKHTVPQWFQDAKLGIFVHWRVYSVPAWAPPTGKLNEVLEEHGWEYWFAHNPYAEWYANSIKIAGSPSQEHHLETYGADFSYGAFAPEFDKAVQAWSPDDMAQLFAEAGAKYVVLTTKHHDGFLLWPSKTPNPVKGASWETERDLVGELTEAVRAQNMHMGLYYSGGYDWTFNNPTVNSFETLLSSINQSSDYETYATTHWKELIDTYKPSLLWNDLGYPASADLNALFAYYYNAVPGGVVNNRFDLDPESTLHYDFLTPEYAVLEDIDPNKWESTRGLGYSFGYNQNENPSIYLTVDELVDSFVDIVSKNGNLLLNVGPMADGTIPAEQRQRILGLGAWLKVNGEAIYGSKPWERAADTLKDDTEVRYTEQDDALYAILLSKPASETVALDIPAAEGSTISLLGQPEALAWEQTDEGVVITLPKLRSQPAYTLVIK